MMGYATNETMPDDDGWAIRVPMLAGLGLVGGLMAHALVGNGWGGEVAAWRMALLSMVLVGLTVFGFAVERDRWQSSALFAIGCGAVAGLIALWNGPVSGWGASEGWRTVSILLAIGIATPLFQAAVPGSGRLPHFPYPAVHGHAWTNAVTFGATWIFVGIVFLMTFLLSELFALIELRFLRDLLREDCFWRVLIGVAFGGGLGLLREQDRIVRLLQKVVTSVLGVLAPVLGFALLFFLAALPFTGFDALWKAWGSAASLLLSCVVGGLLLVNAVVGSDAGDHTKSRVLRAGALALAVVILPLAVLAATAIGMRIGQYGFTPDRLWALTAAIVASACGVAYWVAVGIGRRAWAAPVRVANLRLAMGICALAVVLATPLVSFNAIATRDQVARLESGRTKAADVDWAALRYDFGAPGKAAVERLARSSDAAIRDPARKALASKTRWEVDDGVPKRDAAQIMARVRVLPTGTTLPPALVVKLGDYPLCGDGRNRCTVAMIGATEALVFKDGCFDEMKPTTPDSAEESLFISRLPCIAPDHVVLRDGAWTTDRTGGPRADKATVDALKAGFAAGKVEVRPVARRQAFVGTVPVGDAFE